MKDHLAKLSPEEVAKWYLRLASSAEERAKCTNVTQPLSGLFLRTWIENRTLDKVYEFEPPEHLKESMVVRNTLSFHRDVFLTKKKARLGTQSAIYLMTANFRTPRPADEQWRGVLPRIQEGKWDMKKKPFLDLEYSSLCDFAPTPTDIDRIQKQGTPAEQDLLTSLRGFQLKSKVKLYAAVSENSVAFHFISWVSSGTDRYDFNAAEGLELPNPDFGTGPVAPEKERIKVLHKHAEKLENLGLACPYQVVIKPWEEPPSSVQITDLATWEKKDLTK